MKNNKSLYVVCSKKSEIPLKDGWTPTVYTSKREALYMGVNDKQSLIEYIPKRKVMNNSNRIKEER